MEQPLFLFNGAAIVHTVFVNMFLIMGAHVLQYHQKNIMTSPNVGYEGVELLRM